ncbi:MAG: acetylornithine transaminase [Deltaproteobacteria bacterium]|nr:acetylornithine transaminase [Deltaproteobacteria bacterium]
MKNDTISMADDNIAGTYTRFPIVLTKGSGSTLWDEEGRRYTDFIAGIAVCNLGHAHPRIAQAVSRQAGKLCHVSNLYYTRPQAELARVLVSKCFADRAFFCNSGAEANEAAIKIARKYFSDRKQPEKYRIISMQQSFHGRTLATLSATGQDKIKKGFDPLLNGFDFVPFNDMTSLEKALTPETCAVMLEPVQGEGGIVCPGPEYLKAVRAFCDRNDLLMIFDEVQTGMGRTGKLFAYEHFGITPDVMTLAKALANGFPMGAMLASKRVAPAFGPGAHASTFGGTPVISAAALETMKILSEEGIVQRCTETGEYFRERLAWLKERHPVIEEVRGIGLLCGIKLNQAGAKIVAACLERGFLINCIQDSVLRFAPPLIIEKVEIDALIECLDQVIKSP